MGVAAGDFDAGGKMDLIVPNDKLMNSFFRSRCGGRFQEAGFDANVALREDGTFISGMGVDFRDLDNDGYPDIVLVALDGETFPIYRNTGKGSFVEVTRESGMTKLSLPMAGYLQTSPISTMTAGRTFLFRAAMCNRFCRRRTYGSNNPTPSFATWEA